MPKKILPKPVALSVREAANFLSVSRSRIYELIKAGELVAYKDGARTLILTASCEEWLERLKPFPASPPPTSPLLPPEDRKLARRRARDPETDATGPLLPAERQQIAIERAEPEPEPGGEEQPASEPPDHAYALVFAERFKLLIRNLGHDEGRLRAIEYTVRFYLSQNPSANLDQATKIVLAAIKQSSTTETATAQGAKSP